MKNKISRWLKLWLRRHEEIRHFNIIMKACLIRNDEKEFWEYMIGYSENELIKFERKIK